MAVTLKDVARRAGVSASAVSRAFTEGASVSTQTREKVMLAAAELGYSPNALASSLTTGRTRMVGLVANNFHNPYYLEVFDRFTSALQARGLRPLLVNLTDEKEPDSSVRMLRQYSVDGVVVASSTLPPEFSTAFSASNIPVVHAFARHSRNPDVDTVGIDNVECGRLAASELLARGYRKVGFIGGPTDATSTFDRLAGFRERLGENGIEPISVIHAENYSFNAGRDAMNALIAAPPLAEAYFCGDDVISIGAMSALTAKGYTVPGDVGLLGVNDMEIAGWDNINLTTIRQPTHAIVENVISRLVDLMDKPDDPPKAIRLEPVIIDRATLRPRR